MFLLSIEKNLCIGNIFLQTLIKHFYDINHIVDYRKTREYLTRVGAGGRVEGGWNANMKYENEDGM